MDEASITIGQTVKKKVFAALLGGFLFLGGLAAVFGVTGTAFAMPLGGMGDFYVTFDKLDGNGFSLNPHIGETGDSDASPMVRNQIDSATVNGLRIYKDLKLPTGKWIRINIHAAQPTEIKGLIQDARFIDANLQFHSLSVAEHNTSSMTAAEAFKKNWGQKADDVTITDGKIVTDYLFQDMVSLQGAKISIENIDHPDNGTATEGNGKKGDNHAVTVGGNDGGSDNGGNSGNTTTVSGNAEDNSNQVSANNSGSSHGGMLPMTASDNWLEILLGGLLIAAGAVFVLKKKLFRRLGDQ
jgi:LPXTG-motif cell wall-anchored protein